MPNELVHTPAAEGQRQRYLTQLHAPPRLPWRAARQISHDTGEAMVSANRLNGTSYVGYTGMRNTAGLLDEKDRIISTIPVENLSRRLEAEACLGPIAEAMAAVSVAEVYGMHRRCCE